MATNPGKTIRIGAGSGWSNDRISPAKELVEKVDLDYLLFETMSEQTQPMARDRMAVDPSYEGYDWFLDQRIDAVLATCHKKGTKIVSNQGWVNPVAAQQHYLRRAREMGLKGMKVAAVTYNDITDQIFELGGELMDEKLPVSSLKGREILSVEPYNGAEAVIDGLGQGAHVVVTGKISDPTLAIGPLLHEFGWTSIEDISKAGVVGVMLECGASGVCGGFMADPPHIEIPGIRDGLAYPFIEIDNSDGFVVSKAPGTNGFVSSLGCRTSLIREIFDPGYYEDPNIIMDLTQIQLENIGPNRVRMSNFKGFAKPEKLKVNIAYRDGYMWQDFAYFAGPRALSRARLNAEIIENQLRKGGFSGRLRVDFVGYNAFHGSRTPVGPEPYELMLRIAAKSYDMKELNWVGNEFDAIGPCGVQGTGKGIAPASRIKQVTALSSTLIPRSAVHQSVHVEEV